MLAYEWVPLPAMGAVLTLIELVCFDAGLPAVRLGLDEIF